MIAIAYSEEKRVESPNVNISAEIVIFCLVHKQLLLYAALIV
jgi:hypothetical protein